MTAEKSGDIDIIRVATGIQRWQGEWINGWKGPAPISELKQKGRMLCTRTEKYLAALIT